MCGKMPWQHFLIFPLKRKMKSSRQKNVFALSYVIFTSLIPSLIEALLVIEKGTREGISMESLIFR